MEVESFAADGLELVRLEDFRDPDAHRWRPSSDDPDRPAAEPADGRPHPAARPGRLIRAA